MDMRGYGASDKPSGVENYVMEKLDNDLKVGHLYELWSVILPMHAGKWQSSMTNIIE